MYIAIEGPDKTGKSTILKILGDLLNKASIEHLSIKEPSSRSIVSNASRMPVRYQIRLFNADRINQIRNVVVPALKEGKLVVSDRCFISTVIYQGYFVLENKKVNNYFHDELVARAIDKQLDEVYIPPIAKAHLDKVFIVKPANGKYNDKKGDKFEKINREYTEFMYYRYIPYKFKDLVEIVEGNSSEEIAYKIFSRILELMQVIIVSSDIEHNLYKPHPDDLGLDIRSAENVTISPGEIKVIKTGLRVHFPHNMGGILKDRSSFAAKGLFLHGGVIDPGYTGEIRVILFNASGEVHTIHKSERIAQLIPVRLRNVKPINISPDYFEELTHYKSRKERGFGSSGK